MRRVRVLVVDDSVVARRLVAEALAADPALEVAGAAPNGRIALAKIPQLNPDLVTLDVEMPEMGGLETLRAIRRDHPTLPVIILSSLTERGAATALDSLWLGANDYVTKPAGAANGAEAVERLRGELVPRIRVFCARLLAERASRSQDTRSRPRPPGPSPRVELVAVGASTGGPNALAEVLERLGPDFPVPIVIAQHMPPIFTRILAERLTARSSLRVREGAAGEVLEPGSAWIAPGNHHMEVARDPAGLHLEIHQGPPENSCRPAVDVLFRSAVRACGSGVVAAVLTGMGQDGLAGCDRIRDAGGRVLVQDEASSVVWGMPGMIAQAGLADEILPLRSLGDRLDQWTREGRP